MLLPFFVVAAVITFIGWAMLTVFAYVLAFKGRRQLQFAVLSLVAAGAGAVISGLTLVASILFGSTFAGPMLVVLVVWNLALAALGFLALSGKPMTP